jgi:hypothetical protein
VSGEGAGWLCRSVKFGQHRTVTSLTKRLPHVSMKATSTARDSVHTLELGTASRCASSMV